MRRSLGTWFGGRCLAEEIVLLDRREPGMRIGTADQAELVGIYAEFGFHLEAVLECRTDILEFQHLRLLHLGQIEVTLVPAFEIRKFVVGRKKWMGLAIALDLRGFVKRLPARAVLRIFAVDPLAIEQLDDRKHPAVAQIAVVRQRENFRAGFFLNHRHPFPEIARIWTAERRQRGERFDEASLCSVVAPDDIAMKVVAASVRGPLIADESSEAARFIGFFRRLDRFAPGAAIGRRPRRGEALRHLPLAEAGDDIDGRLRTLAGIDLVVPLPALRRRQQAGIAADQLREKAHAVRMVRYHHEIQRSRKFRALSAGSDNFLALGKAIGVLWTEPGAERAGVHRV